MSKIKVADFYYGAVLSMLFSHGIKPALVENGADRQVYDITTDKSEFRLYVKYRANKNNTKKLDYSSWVFTIKDDTAELQSYINNGYKLIVTLVCGEENLGESQLAVLDTEQITEIINSGKKNNQCHNQKGRACIQNPD